MGCFSSIFATRASVDDGMAAQPIRQKGDLNIFQRLAIFGLFNRGLSLLDDLEQQRSRNSNQEDRTSSDG